MLDQKWMTIEEAANVLGCTPDHVRLLARQEKLDAEKVGKTMWVIRRESVAKFSKKPYTVGRPRKNQISS